MRVSREGSTLVSIGSQRLVVGIHALCQGIDRNGTFKPQACRFSCRTQDVTKRWVEESRHA